MPQRRQLTITFDILPTTWSRRSFHRENRTGRGITIASGDSTRLEAVEILDAVS